jgi:hypothetical protein
MPQRQLTIRLDEELLWMVKNKCKNRLGISVSALIKIFLKAFITQAGVGFYIGDDDLCKLYARWLNKKKNNLPFGLALKDLYELSSGRENSQFLC